MKFIGLTFLFSVTLMLANNAHAFLGAHASAQFGVGMWGGAQGCSSMNVPEGIVDVEDDIEEARKELRDIDKEIRRNKRTRKALEKQIAAQGGLLCADGGGSLKPHVCEAVKNHIKTPLSGGSANWTGANVCENSDSGIAPPWSGFCTSVDERGNRLKEANFWHKYIEDPPGSVNIEICANEFHVDPAVRNNSSVKNCKDGIGELVNLYRELRNLKSESQLKAEKAAKRAEIAALKGDKEDIIDDYREGDTEADYCYSCQFRNAPRVDTMTKIGSLALGAFGAYLGYRGGKYAVDQGAKLGWPVSPWAVQAGIFPMAMAGIYGATYGGGGGYGCHGTGGPMGMGGPYGMYPGQGGAFGMPPGYGGYGQGGGMFMPGAGPWGMAGYGGYGGYGGAGGWFAGASAQASLIGLPGAFPAAGFPAGGFYAGFPAAAFPAGVAAGFPAGGFPAASLIGQAAFIGLPAGFPAGGFPAAAFPAGVAAGFPAGGFPAAGLIGQAAFIGLPAGFPAGVAAGFPAAGVGLWGQAGVAGFPAGVAAGFPAGVFPAGGLGGQYQLQMLQMQQQQQQMWIQQQQAAYQEQVNRQQMVGRLQQELFRIQQQIQQITYGGYGGGSVGNLIGGGGSFYGGGYGGSYGTSGGVSTGRYFDGQTGQQIGDPNLGVQPSRGRGF